MDTELPLLSCGDRQVKILVVDDDEDNSLLLTYQLAQLITCSVLSAQDGFMALSLAQSAQPDLILLDIMLPGLDGFEVARRLKQNPQTQQIPIVAVTAMARIQDQELAIESGCNDYMRKPYELERLGEMLQRHLKPCPCLSADRV